MEFVADLLYDLPKNYGLAFDIVHYIVCLQGERLDMGLQFSETSQNHPLVSTKYTEQFWIMNFMLHSYITLCTKYLEKS